VSAADHLQARLDAAQAHIAMIQAEIAKVYKQDEPITPRDLAKIVALAGMSSGQAALTHEAQVLRTAATKFSSYSKSTITEAAAAKKILSMAEYAQNRADQLVEWKPAKR
jgi:hypothetical protein